ncbi:MAG: mechanosensitive ion channel [Candidatus Eisenbacteria bacterium]|uniref:Mechanosensitive ion channel n=1 Tax=Eiseniibacteriota bacterium TaxID=2212470 RepID=A0A956LX35_UNCEI|nr:mechanosensitive ion channel [Candidatus Eisenbacteria bacterium]
MENALEQLRVFAVTYGIRIVGAILILIAGRIVAGMVRNGVRSVLQKRDVEPGLRQFFGSLSYALIIAFAAIAALGKFGVETASFVAVLGAAGFAIGFALQGSLSNFASGVMILLFRPFKVGDFIEAAGVAGSVAEVQLFNTFLNTPDNVRIIVPNSAVYSGTIKNYSANPTRRVDLTIGIGYGSSIEAALTQMQTLIEADDRISKEPAPFLAVTELADSSVNLVVRVWVKSADYWGVKFDLTRQIKEQFDASGIEIPFPQRVVHLQQSQAS